MFITFEGTEGSGKTSVLREITNRLQKDCYITTREPGGVPIAEAIRSVILDERSTGMDEWTEAYLYTAARRQHLIERVIPALEEGKIVLCDRFIDSSLAYQGYARGLGIDAIESINRMVIGSYMPDVTIYFDVQPEVGLQRIFKSRSDEVNRFDQESLNFHKKVYEGYTKVRERFPERIRTVDASQPIEQVIEEVWKIVEDAIRPSNHS